MSRSGYSDEESFPGQFDLYEQRLRNAIRGRRGQRFLREMIAALDAMPKRELIDRAVAHPDGAVCALGSVAQRRGIDLSEMTTDADVDVDDYENVEHTTWLGDELDIAECLAREVAYQNDEFGSWDETPAQRWTRMRAWAVEHLRAEAAS